MTLGMQVQIQTYRCATISDTVSDIGLLAPVLTTPLFASRDPARLYREPSGDSGDDTDPDISVCDYQIIPSVILALFAIVPGLQAVDGQQTQVHDGQAWWLCTHQSKCCMLGLISESNGLMAALMGARFVIGVGQQHTAHESDTVIIVASVSQSDPVSCSRCPVKSCTSLDRIKLVCCPMLGWTRTIGCNTSSVV
jgi:hypothetical protein